MGTRGPKNNWPILGQPGQLHSWFEAAHYCTDFLFYCGEFYSQIYTFIFANYSCPQKIIPYIWGPWTDTQMIQSCIHSPLPCLPSKTKSRQIHGLLFLPKSAHQKLFPYIWGPWIGFKAAYTSLFSAFLLEQKQANPLAVILARICLPKIIPPYPGSLYIHIHDSKLHTLLLALLSF